MTKRKLGDLAHRTRERNLDRQNDDHSRGACGTSDYIFCSHTSAPGGGELALARYLAQSKTHNKRLFTLEDGSVWNEVRAAGVEVETWGDRSELMRIMRFRRAVREQRNSIFVANSMKIALILAICLKRNQPLVYWLRDGLSKSGSSPIGVSLTKLITLKRAGGFIANSHWTKAALGEHLGSANVQVAYSPAGADRYLHVAGPSCNQFRKLNDGRTLKLLYLGRLAEWKGPHIAVAAVKDLIARGTEVQLDIAGSALFGEETYALRLKDSVREVDAIRFLGHINDPALIIEDYDAVLHCSLKPEPFGQVIVQALAAGRVVFATNHGGPAEIIRAGHDGILVAPGQPAELADAICSTFMEAGRADELSANARFSAEKFRDDILCTQLDESLQKLTANLKQSHSLAGSETAEAGQTSVAIVHDYLTQRGGAEKVVLALARAFPEAPIYTTLYNPESTYPEFRDLDVRASFLNRFGVFRRHHRLALPLLPAAVASLRPTETHLLVSSSGWAHGIRRTAGAKIVYCYSPARWLYQREAYLGSEGSRVKRLAIRLLSAPLKHWDRKQAWTADQYLAISSVVRERISECYGIESTVVPAPQTLAGSDLSWNDDVEWTRQPIAPGFYLCVSRLLPYKNVDQIVRAFRPGDGRRLVILGKGPEEARLRALACSSVEFVQDLTDIEVRWLYRNCAGVVACSYEDFGLSPLEGAMYGKPAAVLRWGGYLDTVKENETGVFFDRPEPAAVRSAIEKVEATTWNATAIRSHAMSFSEERFARAIRHVLRANSRPVHTAGLDSSTASDGD